MGAAKPTPLPYRRNPNPLSPRHPNNPNPLHPGDAGDAGSGFGIGAQALEGVGAMSGKHTGSSIEEFLKEGRYLRRSAITGRQGGRRVATPRGNEEKESG